MRDFRWLVPFFALALAVSLWAIWEQKVHQGAQGDEWDQTLAERAVIAGRVFWFYLAKLGWPDPLVFIYPRWAVAADQFGAYLPLLLALVLGAVVCVWRKTVSRGAYFALGFYVAMLFPVLGFFDIYFFRYSYVADHFQYLAGMAPLAFVAGAVQRVAAGGWRTRQRALFTGGSVLLLAALAQRSVTHARQFHDDTTLWTATLRHNPASFLAWNNLGTLSLEAGRFAEAEERFRRALALHPHLGQTHYNLGRTLNAMDRRNEALEHYLAAVRVDPQPEPAHLNLANALAGLPGREAEAVRHYAEALRLDPKNALTHTNLATVLGNLPGRLADAVAHAETAVRLDPQSPSAHLNLGVLLARIPERLSSAIAHFETALRLKPDYVKAHLNLGLALVAIPGRIEEGIRAYEAALRHEPRSATAHNNLGVARAQQQRWPEAIFHFEAATRIDPNFVEARENLSALRSAIANVPP